MPDRSAKITKIIEELRKDLSEEELRQLASTILGQQRGRKGGPARAKRQSGQQRTEIARKAALARWKKHDKKD